MNKIHYSLSGAKKKNKNERARIEGWMEKNNKIRIKI